jgi:hypothetical protein
MDLTGPIITLAILIVSGIGVLIELLCFTEE